MATSVHQGLKRSSPEKPVLFTQGFTPMSRNENAKVRNVCFVASLSSI